MGKKYLPLLLFLFSLFVPVDVKAGLVTIKTDGEVVNNVLSFSDGLSLETPESDRFEITNVQGKKDEKVYLSKEDGLAYLAVGEGGKKYDVTNVEEDVVEIEERNDVKRLRILLSDGKFILSQEGFNVETESPIEIDPKSGRIMVETSSGKNFLAILPLDAATTTLRSKNITKIKNASIVDTDEKNVVYRFSGDKEIGFLKMFDYSVNVDVDVSVATGEIVKVNQPVWLYVLNFLT